MADLTKLKDYEKHTRRTGYPTALAESRKARTNPQRKGVGAIAKSYLGFDPVEGLDNATSASNATLLAEVAKLETKTTDMRVAGEAFRRKATNLTEQGVIRSETVRHVLNEAEKLGVAQNAENTAVIEFLKAMALANAKADNSEAFTNLSGRTAYDEENAKFSERVRNLFAGVEQKAIDFAESKALADKMRGIKHQEGIIDKWIAGKANTKDAIEAYNFLQAEKGEKPKSIIAGVGDYIQKVLGI